MSYALFWSGGKDSLLALDRATQEGVPITHLINIYDGQTDRVKFHGVKRSAIALQAAALGKTLIQRRADSDHFEEAFLSLLGTLKSLDIRGVCFGNIHLSDIRAWYEQRSRSFGFDHIEPLWGGAPRALLNEFVQRGHLSRIVSVHSGFGRPAWLGETFSAPFVRDLLADKTIDACGERGEYHSFAFGGPLFTTQLKMAVRDVFESDSHLILDFDVEET